MILVGNSAGYLNPYFQIWCHSMVEVEIKFPAPDLTRFEQYLQERQAVFVIERQERDEYFNAPDRDFAQTDEALRIRQVGDVVKLTYKGPRRDQLTKTRTEIEVGLAEAGQGAEALSQILVCLKYRPSGQVIKRRRIYRIGLNEFEAEISLDSVSDLGDYVELEIVVDEARVDAARDELLALAQTLGLRHPERRSYLELIKTSGATDK
jgi:adenylate cyclase class 2